MTAQILIDGSPSQSGVAFPFTRPVAARTLSMNPLPASGEYWSSQIKPTTARDRTTGVKKMV
jgi:hypothetical protein